MPKRGCKRVFNAREVRVHIEGNSHIDVSQYAFCGETRRVAMGTVDTSEGEVDVVLKLCTPTSHKSTRIAMQSAEYAKLGRTPGVQVSQYAASGKIDHRKAKEFDEEVACNAHIETHVPGVTLEHAWKTRTSKTQIQRLREAYRAADTELAVFTVGLVDMEHVSTASAATTNEDVLLDPRVHVDLSIPAERAVIYRAFSDVLCDAASKKIRAFIKHVLQDADDGEEPTGYIPRGTGAWGPSASAVRSTSASVFPPTSALTQEELIFAFLVVPVVCRLASACTSSGVYPHDARLSNIMVRIHDSGCF